MAKKELPTLKDVSRIPEELLPVVNWWQDHGPRTLGWVAAAVVVCAVAYFWHANQAAADANAVVALANAAQTADFEAVAALDAEASPLARLDLAHSLYAPRATMRTPLASTRPPSPSSTTPPSATSPPSAASAPLRPLAALTRRSPPPPSWRPPSPSPPPPTTSPPS